jgi:hypothetical protein
MNLEYAVERLYQAGWHPSLQCDQEALPDGRKYPSIDAAKREFADAGLQLTLKHNMMFNCYYATWSPVRGDGSGLSGTVIGTDAREAAVYALAQLRASQARRELQTA